MKITIPRPRSLTRLQRGMIVEMEGLPYFIDLANDCRARAVPMNKRHHERTTLDGKKIAFDYFPPAHNICPNSEIPILASNVPDIKTAETMLKKANGKRKQ